MTVGRRQFVAGGLALPILPLVGYPVSAVTFAGGGADATTVTLEFLQIPLLWRG